MWCYKFVMTLPLTNYAKFWSVGGWWIMTHLKGCRASLTWHSIDVRVETCEIVRKNEEPATSLYATTIMCIATVAQLITFYMDAVTVKWKSPIEIPMQKWWIKSSSNRKKKKVKTHHVHFQFATLDRRLSDRVAVTIIHSSRLKPSHCQLIIGYIVLCVDLNQ